MVVFFLSLLIVKMVNYCRDLGCHKRFDREKDWHFYRLSQIIKNQGEDGQNISEDRRRQTQHISSQVTFLSNLSQLK